MVEVVHEVTSNLSISPEVMAELRAETGKDKGLQLVLVIQYYQRGWPRDKAKISQEAMPYSKLKDNLFVEDGLVILEDEVVVPPSLRPKVLNSLHLAHLGIDKTKARARQTVY
ncbi:hypothetical protein FOCC_FOCC015737 [Frankliniella occidentalis]|nr:hypothetical protein FOCC_FOCC015737 [Frankliniella occidentalis]